MKKLRSLWGSIVFTTLSFLVRLANKHYVIVSDSSGLSRASRDLLGAEVDEIRKQLNEAEQLEDKWQAAEADFKSDYYESLKIQIQLLNLGSKNVSRLKSRSVNTRKWTIIFREIRKEGSRWLVQGIISNSIAGFLETCVIMSRSESEFPLGSQLEYFKHLGGSFIVSLAGTTVMYSLLVSAICAELYRFSRSDTKMENRQRRDLVWLANIMLTAIGALSLGLVVFSIGFNEKFTEASEHYATAIVLMMLALLLLTSIVVGFRYLVILIERLEVSQ